MIGEGLVGKCESQCVTVTGGRCLTGKPKRIYLKAPGQNLENIARDLNFVVFLCIGDISKNNQEITLPKRHQWNAQEQ